MKLLQSFRYIILTTALCICATLTQITGNAQLVTFSVKGASLEMVFVEIEQQTSIRFIYTREDLALARQVTVSVINQNLKDALDRCFKSQPLSYTRIKDYVVVRLNTLAEPSLTDLQGIITNKEGSPVAGVSISISTQEQYSISDANGIFQFFQIDPTSVLKVSGAEIEPQMVKVNFRQRINIVVNPRVSVLDETVIVGYNRMNRRYATSKVEKVNAISVERQQVSNPITALSGRVAGLSVRQASGVPGTFISVALRGQNSISNGNDPLFILDGLPFPSSALNGKFGGPSGLTSSPFDNINPEDIESIEVLKDAASTAIYGSRGANGVIVMSSKKGAAGTGINFNYQTGFGKITRSIPMLNGQEYLRMRRNAFENEKMIPTIEIAPDLLVWDSTRFTDWQALLIGGTMHRNQISTSVSGGNVLTQFRFSGLAMHETTVFPGNFGRKKYGSSLSLTHKDLNRRFHFTAQASFVSNLTRTPREDLVRFIATPPVAPVPFKEDGSLNWANGTWINPFASLLQVFKYRSYNMQSVMDVGYKFSNGIALKLMAGGSAYGVDELSEYPSSSFDPSINPKSQAIYGSRKLNLLIAEPQLSYQLKKSKNVIDIITGLTFQQSRLVSLYQWGQGYPSDDQLGAITAATVSKVITEEESLYRYMGAYVRMDFNHNKKYIISASLRRDGSSRYGPENRFSNFSSLGLAWLFSKEQFLERVKQLSYGKLSFSFGNTGNDQIGDYKYLQLYSSGSYTYQGLPAFQPSQLSNPMFGWEKVNKLQMGVELGFIRDRILLSSYYYRHLTGNQILYRSLSAVTGFNGILENLPTRLINSGWEFQVNAIPINKKTIKWNIDINVTVPQSKLMSYPDLAAEEYADRFVIGRPLAIRKCYNLLGVDKRTGLYTFRDYNQDGKITEKDRQSIVNASITYFGGIEQSVTIKNFSVGLFIHFVGEPKAEPIFASFVSPGEMSNQPGITKQYWGQPGDQSKFQRVSLDGSEAAMAYERFLQSDGALSNASFLRIQNLFLSYNFPSIVLKRLHLRKMSVFLSAQNLFTITSYQGLDPETKGQTPLIRLITAGFNLNF